MPFSEVHVSEHGRENPRQKSFRAWILNDAFAALIICLSHDNLIAVASIAALSDVKKALVEYDVNGTIVLLGIPAERMSVE